MQIQKFLKSRQIILLILFSIVLTFVATSCSTTKNNTGSQNFLGKKQFAVTEIYGTTVVCMSAKKTDCGMTLYECQNGLIYLCAQNVAIIDIKQVNGLSE